MNTTEIQQYSKTLVVVEREREILLKNFLILNCVKPFNNPANAGLLKGFLLDSFTLLSD